MNKMSNIKLLTMMLCTLLTPGSKDIQAAPAAPEGEPAGRASESKTVDQKNQETVRETQAQTAATKAQADALNADVFKKTNAKSPTTNSTTSTTSSLTEFVFGKPKPAAPQSAPVETTGSFDLTSTKTTSTQSERTETKSTVDEHGNKVNDLKTKSQEINNQASDLQTSTSKLLEQTKQRQQESKLFTDKNAAQAKTFTNKEQSIEFTKELDPKNKLTEQEKNMVTDKSQSWISPYEGSKFQEWVESVTNLINGDGFKSNAQIDDEAQAKAISTANKVAQQEKQYNEQQKQIDTQQNTLNDLLKANKDVNGRAKADTPEITKAKESLNQLNSQQARTLGDIRDSSFTTDRTKSENRRYNKQLQAQRNGTSTNPLGF